MIADCDNCSVFSLERQAFNHIINSNTIKRNEERLKMLSKVPIFKTLGQYEILKILDACRHVEFDQGEYVITEGEPGEAFYILLEGKAVATKLLDDSLQPKRVIGYKSGDYFGERALLKNATRSANIIAETGIKCLMLNRVDFKKLLGPIEDILKRNMKIYINYID
jgi:cAMP-dependent protein kinase regulator